MADIITYTFMDVGYTLNNANATAIKDNFMDVSTPLEASAAPSGWTHKINGVLNSAISKINGISKASISKVNGA